MSSIFRFIKKKLYFIVAYYFRLFAKIQLSKWQPRIIVVTGSSGKTSLLHLIESQLKNQARYSHQANSTFGIPFDILGLKRKSLLPSEWLYLILAAPFKAFKKPYGEKIYVAEVDCERPNEGEFLASLLRPEVTLWTNSGSTHTQSFDYLVAQKKFTNVQQAIAHEFGFLPQYTSSLVIINGDSNLILEESKRSKALVKTVSEKDLNVYEVAPTGTKFEINKNNYQFKHLLPKDFFYSLQMTKELLGYLKVDFDNSFENFSLPPGRSSVFLGIKNTTLVDSTYNATPDGMVAILKMFQSLPSNSKWLVLGDMIELGNEEQTEHEKLAETLLQMEFQKVLLVGPRLIKYTLPKLKSLVGKVEAFEFPNSALDYLNSNLQGGETILFKGARFLEGVVEHLLLNKSDAQKLCRREVIYQKRRKEWGL